MSEHVVIEGTWEEIVARGDELAGRKVRLTILDTPVSAPPAVAGSGTREYRANRIFESDEISAPFDLPRPGPGVPVRARKGGTRLPDIPAEWKREN